MLQSNLLIDTIQRMDSFTETGPSFSQATTYKDTFRFGNEYAHVEISNQALRDDFVKEALAQGLGEDIALTQAARTQFFLGDFNEYFKTTTMSEHPILRSIMKAREGLFGKMTPVACVAPNKTGSVEFFYDVNYVVNNIAKNKSLPQFKMTSNMPFEAKQTALTQALDSIWRHERQHLIQQTDPEYRKFTERYFKYGQIIQNAAITGLVGGAVSITLPVPEDLRTQYAPYAVLTVIGSGVVGMANMMYHNWGAKWENEARQLQSADKFTGNSPFKVTFEK